MTALEERPSRAAGAIPARTQYRPVVLVEIVLLLAGYLGFSLVQAHLGQTHREAMANADRLIGVERALHLDIEVSANHLLIGHEWLVDVTGYFYGGCLIVPPLVLIWLYLRRPRPYAFLRRALVTSTVLSLPLFWLFAVAPPRFAMSGITDYIALHDILDGATSRDSGTSSANLYAAMPSLHVAWAFWCAFAIWVAFRRNHSRLALLAWAYPLLTAFDVIVTGNHYLLDVLGGVALALTGIALSAAWELRRSSGDQQPNRERDHDHSDQDVQDPPGDRTNHQTRGRAGAVSQR